MQRTAAMARAAFAAVQQWSRPSISERYAGQPSVPASQQKHSMVSIAHSP